MSAAKHLEYITRKVAKYKGCLKKVNHVMGYLGPDTNRMLFKSIVRSRMEYATPV